MEAIDHGDDRTVERELAAAERLLTDAPDTDRVRRERDSLERVREALRMRDTVMARKRFATQRSMSRRSFDSGLLSTTKHYASKQEALQARRAARGDDRAGDTDHGRPNGASRFGTLFGDTQRPGRDASADDDALDVSRADGTVGTLRLRVGDLTEWAGDAIVNPTNPHLHGSGASVDGAVHRRGGMHLTRECRAIGHVEIGQAVVTKGWDLPADYVLHTAVPVFDGSDEAFEALASCYRSSLALARQMRLRRIAFPAIGTGTNRFPIGRAAEVALREIVDGLSFPDGPAEVDVMAFDGRTLAAFRRALASLRHRSGRTDPTTRRPASAR